MSPLIYYETYIEAVIDQGPNSDEVTVQEGGLNIHWNERAISILLFYQSSVKSYWGVVYLRRLTQYLTDRKVVNPLKENCIKGNIILDLWAFKDSPSGNSSQKSLAVLFPLTEGFMVCLRVKNILFSACYIRESRTTSKILQ